MSSNLSFYKKTHVAHIKGLFSRGPNTRDQMKAVFNYICEYRSFFLNYKQLMVAVKSKLQEFIDQHWVCTCCVGKCCPLYYFQTLFPDEVVEPVSPVQCKRHGVVCMMTVKAKNIALVIEWVDKIHDIAAATITSLNAGRDIYGFDANDPTADLCLSLMGVCMEVEGFPTKKQASQIMTLCHELGNAQEMDDGALKSHYRQYEDDGEEAPIPYILSDEDSETLWKAVLAILSL